MVLATVLGPSPSASEMIPSRTPATATRWAARADPHAQVVRVTTPERLTARNSPHSPSTMAAGMMRGSEKPSGIPRCKRAASRKVTASATISTVMTVTMGVKLRVVVFIMHTPFFLLDGYHVPDVQVGASSTACSEACNRGHDLTTNNLERRDPIHVRDYPQDRLDAHGGQPAQLPDQVAPLGAILARVEGEHASLLYRIVIPALGFTMPPQGLQLLWDLRSRAQVAGVSVPGDQAQGLVLTGARNQDRRMGPAETLREVERALAVVVFPLERTLVTLLSLPHTQADLEHLLQPLVTLFQWREGQSRPACLLFVVTSANAQPGTPPRQHIQGGHRLGQQDWLPVRAGRCQSEQLDAAGVGSKVCQRGIA